MKYIELDTIDSTNEYLKRNIDTLEHLTIVRAHFQTQGKGRNGHVWESHKKNDLLLSILLKEFEEPQLVHQMTQVIAVAMIEALKSYDLQAFIKWPNDIYVNDLKICGILLETMFTTNLQGIVIGVGLNVNDTGEYQTMANCKGKQFDINEIMIRFLTQFLMYYQIYLQGAYQQILDKANRLSYLKNKPIEYLDYGLVTFERLNSDGTIDIKDQHNHNYTIHSNEISLHRQKVGV